MTLSLLIDDGPLERRIALLDGEKVISLRIDYPGDRSPLLGAVGAFTVGEQDRRLGAVFGTLTGGAPGFLRRGGKLPGKGARVLAEVRREPVGDKGAEISDKPVLRLPMGSVGLDGEVRDGPLGEGEVAQAHVTAFLDGEDPAPSALRAAFPLITSDLSEVLVTARETAGALVPFFPDDLPISLVDPLDVAAIIDPAAEEALSRTLPLEGGGRLVVDEAEALIAIDLDLGTGAGQSAKGAGQRLLTSALDRLSRHAVLASLGGQIVIDVPRAAIAAPKIIRDRLTRTFKPLGKVGVPAVSPEGLCVIIAPKRGPTLLERMTVPAPGLRDGRRLRDEAMAARALTALARALNEDRTGHRTLNAAPPVAALLPADGPALAPLLARFGPRFTVASQSFPPDAPEAYHVD